MIEDKVVAARVSTLLLEANGLLNEAAAVISSSACSDKEKSHLYLIISTAMGTIGTKILNHLYRSHRELKPAEWILPEEFKRK